jgi:hypothetical protein
VTNLEPNLSENSPTRGEQSAGTTKEMKIRPAPIDVPVGRLACDFDRPFRSWRAYKLLGHVSRARLLFGSHEVVKLRAK